MIYGRNDPQCARVIGYCEECGCEIYEGNKALETDEGDLVHSECLEGGDVFEDC